MSKLRTAVISVAVLALIATTAVVAVAQGETSDWQAVRGEAITRIGSDYMGAARDQAADNIANDVTSRGTVWRFMLGSDSGVLYGVGPSAVQPEIQVQTKTRTRTETRAVQPEIRLFGTGDAIGDKMYIVGGAEKTFDLPPSDIENVVYMLNGQPDGWDLVLPTGTTPGTLTGSPTAAGTYEVTWLATLDGKSDRLTFTITVVPDEEPTLASGPGDKQFTRGEDVDFPLPKATDTNAPMGAVTYGTTLLPMTLMEEDGRITGTVDVDARIGTFPVTFTATVAGGGPDDTGDTVEGTFFIEIVASVPN